MGADPHIVAGRQHSANNVDYSDQHLAGRGAFYASGKLFFYWWFVAYPRLWPHLDVCCLTWKHHICIHAWPHQQYRGVQQRRHGAQCHRADQRNMVTRSYSDLPRHRLWQPRQISWVQEDGCRAPRSMRQRWAPRPASERYCSQIPHPRSAPASTRPSPILPTCSRRGRSQLLPTASRPLTSTCWKA